MVDGRVVEDIGRHNVFDDILFKFSADILFGDVLGELDGDTDLLVLDGDPRIAAGVPPGQDAGLAHIGEALSEVIGKQRGEQHLTERLIGGSAVQGC